jgi:hypothetical protein
MNKFSWFKAINIIIADLKSKNFEEYESANYLLNCYNLNLYGRYFKQFVERMRVRLMIHFKYNIEKVCDEIYYFTLFAKEVDEREGKVLKSPYSDSFYLVKKNEKIGWGHKPQMSLRISDHWNFGNFGEHCPTKNKAIDGQFSVGIYNFGFYEILERKN